MCDYASVLACALTFASKQASPRGDLLREMERAQLQCCCMLEGGVAGECFVCRPQQHRLAAPPFNLCSCPCMKWLAHKALAPQNMFAQSKQPHIRISPPQATVRWLTPLLPNKQPLQHKQDDDSITHRRSCLLLCKPDGICQCKAALSISAVQCDGFQ